MDPLPVHPCFTAVRHRAPSAAWVLAGLFIALPCSVAAQSDPSPPDTVAVEFLRGFQSMAWEGLAQRLHPDALAYLRLAVDIVVEYDDTGWALANLGGADSRSSYDASSDAAVFVRVMTWVGSHAPGLSSSFASRRFEALGSVAEGEEVSHVVYRVTTLAQGAEPTVQVATLLRLPSGWKVQDAPEIRALHTALRGIPVPRRSADRSSDRR